MKMIRKRRNILVAALSMLLLIMPALCARAVVVERPKLVVGIVVDQMRWDYLKRFAPHFCEGGFARLMKEGYSLNNTQVNYVPTVTAIGHTCVYTGSVPSIHGIAGNNFRKDKKIVYCVEDTTVTPVGTKDKSGLMSPRNLLVTTVGDELRLATNFQSHVISVSLKDRAAIIPGGHTSNGSFWFDPSTGRFITSSYYMQKLPAWLDEFNDRRLPKLYMDKDWNTLHPIGEYQESTEDDVPYEKAIEKDRKPTFPIYTSKLYSDNNYGNLRETPYGNTVTLQLAEAAVSGERLGVRGATDMIAVSLSSTDYVGHRFGPNSVELEDTYLRLDKDLESFFSFLDKTVGAGNYLLFLTADHAGAHNVQFLNDHGIPSGLWSDVVKRDKVNDALSSKFGVNNLVQNIMNYQVFLDNDVIAAHQLNIDEVKSSVVEYLKSLPGIAYAADQEKISSASIPEPIKQRMINGYNRKRSGEIVAIEEPGWYDRNTNTGSTHGVWNPYDSHIPLLFMGWHVPHGETSRQVNMTDISATVASLLNIQQPSGCIGTPIIEIAK